MKNKVGIGIVGSQFISMIYAEALKSVLDAQIITVMSPSKRNAKKFAIKYNIPYHFTQLDELLALKKIDLIIIDAYKSAGTGKKVMMPFKTAIDNHKKELINEA